MAGNVSPVYSVFWRRVLYFTLVGLTTLAGAFLMTDIVRANGATMIEIMILLLFTITFSLIASYFWTAVIGLLIRLFARDPLAYAAPILHRLDPAMPITARTAVIMPIYNEDPERVFAGIESSYRSLAATGELGQFEFFILSDTTRAEVGEEELHRWQGLCDKLDAHDRLRYRRRSANKGRKVGNIADFCERWGAQFEYMIVLDADSVMAGATMLRLVRLMQASPRVGLIQTVPLPVNQETLFARLIQFGSRLSSELLSTGQSFWLQSEGNYYGHNAIIRIQPFMEHCNLPVLSGNGPLGGEILSHDFVEAAFLRRAGWQVWDLPDGSGSFEEMPSNILDYVKRDRRWCQGNLQHMRLLFSRGLHPISRIHFLRGMLSYVSSPLWLLMMGLGLVQIIQQATAEIDYFAPGYNLFPVWPVIKTAEAVSLFVVTILMLLTPKFLAAILVLSDPKQRAAFGGSVALCAGLLLEIVFSTLLAPVMMVFHTLFVVFIVAGYAVSWNPQVRGNRGLSISEALRHHWMQLALGLCVGMLVLEYVPDHIWWLSPVLAGLVLSAPLAVTSSRAEVGRWLLRWHLLATPEETQPDVELQTVRELLGVEVTPAAGAAAERVGVERALGV